MATRHEFHSEALFEYAEAADYYVRVASLRVAEAFIASVEAAIAAIVPAPQRWRIVEEPEIRRYVLSRFPFVIYYRWEPQQERVVIYAVMNCHREPGYWRARVSSRD
jgi:plasmid stabilization system protein ParE